MKFGREQKKILYKIRITCQKEAIEILGILCSCEIHDEAINRTICSTLLNIYSKRADILNEILNALMDIYGNNLRMHFVLSVW